MFNGYRSRLRRSQEQAEEALRLAENRQAEAERLRGHLYDAWWASCGCLGGMLDEFSGFADLEPVEGS